MRWIQSRSRRDSLRSIRKECTRTSPRAQSSARFCDRLKAKGASRSSQEKLATSRLFIHVRRRFAACTALVCAVTAAPVLWRDCADMMHRSAPNHSGRARFAQFPNVFLKRPMDFSECRCECTSRSSCRLCASSRGPQVLPFVCLTKCVCALADAKDRADPTDFSLVELVTLNALGGCHLSTQSAQPSFGSFIHFIQSHRLLHLRVEMLCGCAGKDRFDFAALVEAAGGKRELVTPPPARSDVEKAAEAQRVEEEKRRLCVANSLFSANVTLEATALCMLCPWLVRA